jgi:hypothetical protein
VANLPPQRSRRIQGLPPKEEVRNNSSSPPQRHQLDHYGTFILTGQTEITNIDPPEVNYLEPDEVTIKDLGSGDLTSHFNPPLPNFFMFLVVGVPPPIC